MQKTRPALVALFVAALLFSPFISQAITFTGDTQIGVNDTNFERLDIVVTNCTLTVDGTHTFASLRILQGGTVTHSPVAGGVVPPLSGLTLTVSNNVLVEAGGSFNVDGKGYGGGQGPGKGSSTGSPVSGGGAGHGGNGGYGAGLDGVGAVYETPQAPTDRGSGGGAGSGSGGAGGGAIKLVVGGALLIDGVISANGSDAVTNRAGGGAGGSIWLVAQTLAGSGVISANGGSGELPQGGGGGGGRISLQAAINVFQGQTSAAGGPGYACLWIMRVTLD